MEDIRPVSDPRDPFQALEDLDESLAPPPFTDDPSSPFCTDIEAILDYADRMAEETDVRYTLDEAFDMIRKHTHERKVV